MLSCLTDAVQQRRPVEKCNRQMRAKSSSPAILYNGKGGHSVKSSVACPVDEGTNTRQDKNGFLKLFSLVPTQSSGLHEHLSTNVAVDVIVIDDDDDEEDDQIPQNLDSCLVDLFGTTRPLRRDLGFGSNATTPTSRLLQPSSRLKKLLSIDISSPLGSRTLQYVTSALKCDEMPLNPFTVSHSLAGSDNALDYEMFCRTPVKGVFGGRLRHRDYPVRYRPASAGTHYHYYCFNRADRRRFCQRFDTGLSARSRRLQQKYSRYSVALERLTDNEISDWRSSQRLRDYVTKMQERDKESAMLNVADDDVISLSSDSEDETAAPIKKPDLVFRCHQCGIKLPCGSSFRNLIREHYETSHGIVNIDIVHLVQPDGSVAMQVVHMPPTLAPRPRVVNDSPSIDLTCSDTDSAPTSESDSSQYGVQPNHTQSVLCPVNPPAVTGQAGLVRGESSSGAGEPSGTMGHAIPVSDPHTLTADTQHSIRPTVHISVDEQVPLCPKKLIYSNSLLPNGSMLCRGDAVSSVPASVQSSCDADIICLD